MNASAAKTTPAVEVSHLRTLDVEDGEIRS